MKAQLATRASAILVGNELLNGKVCEANLFALAGTLRALGIRLERVVVVPDVIETIAEEVRIQSAQFDVVFTSGGVGPTHDDLTLDAVGVAFGVSVPVHPELEAMLAQVYPNDLEAARRMALVPEGAELKTIEGVRWPTVVMRNVWILPGVPELFRMKLAVVRGHVRGPKPIITRQIYTLIDEVKLKPLLDSVVAAHPAVEVGSYPKWFDATYKTKVTLDGDDAEGVEAALAALLAALPEGEPQRVE